VSVRESKSINVLNYNPNNVSVKTSSKEYLFEPAIDEYTPYQIPLSFDEIDFLNNNTNTFKFGFLQFPEDIEEEIYTELKITDWKDILTTKQIENIILNPTIDGLVKIVSIKNGSLFERVRSVFTVLKNSGAYDISTRVENVIKTRYKELLDKKFETDIVIKPVQNASENSQEVANLKDELSQLKDMMSQLLEKKTTRKPRSKKQENE
jgi:uncharacterized protein YdcH (DUF465 family)